MSSDGASREHGHEDRRLTQRVVNPQEPPLLGEESQTTKEQIEDGREYQAVGWTGLWQHDCHLDDRGNGCQLERALPPLLVWSALSA